MPLDELIPGCFATLGARVKSGCQKDVPDCRPANDDSQLEELLSTYMSLLFSSGTHEVQSAKIQFVKTQRSSFPLTGAVKPSCSVCRMDDLRVSLLLRAT